MKVSPPSQYQELMHKKIVKIICTASQIVALAVPDLFNYRGLAVIYIAYSILICTVLIALCSYSLYFQVTDFYNWMLPTASVLEIIVTTGGTITNVISVFFVVIFRRKKIVHLVKNLKEIERTLNEKFDSICQLEERYLLVTLALLELFLLTFIVFDTLIEIYEHGVILYTQSIISHINIFMVSLTVFQIQLISTTIKQYFVIVNEQLKRNMQYANAKRIEENPKNRPLKMKFYLQLYDKLCDIIDSVSTSFGIQIALIVFIIIICLIQSMNLIMKFALRIETVPIQWNLLLLLADLWNSIIYIIFGIVLAICCEQASVETNNTSIVCYKILLGYPSYPKSHHEEVTKNELVLLAEHLSLRKIKFTAAGLFAVDHTMLYMIFGSIAAYLVIVLQFK